MSQLPLFERKGKGFKSPPLVLPKELKADSSLTLALANYQEYLKARGYSKHTVKNFLGDISLLSRFLGPEKRLGEIGNSRPK